jgi:hypothetical protein
MGDGLCGRLKIVGGACTDLGGEHGRRLVVDKELAPGAVPGGALQVEDSDHTVVLVGVPDLGTAERREEKAGAGTRAGSEGHKGGAAEASVPCEHRQGKAPRTHKEAVPETPEKSRKGLQARLLRDPLTLSRLCPSRSTSTKRQSRVGRAAPLALSTEPSGSTSRCSRSKSCSPGLSLTYTAPPLTALQRESGCAVV